MDQRALLFTDVVDSTAIVQRLGDAAASLLWGEHDRLARELLAGYGGQEIDRSDGFFLLFDEMLDAVRYAAGYHDIVRQLGLSTRVGLHLGPVTLRRNPAADVARGAKQIEAEGLAKPLAARIMSLARGGQTLMSRAAHDALQRLPEGALIVDHGHYRVKGADEPLQIFELGRPGDGFTPPADTDKAYQVVLIEAVWKPVRDVVNNLTPERDAFIGRNLELHDIARRLDSGSRLLTLVGVGGTGKTRAARRYGRTWLGDWPGGVYFCDLSEARSIEGIYFAVALALGVPLGKDDPGLQLGNAIAGRGRCLVILDNFEQVAEHAQGSLGVWVDRAALAAFLVTSRERLHLAGEEVVEIEPLPLADDAMELFEVRARAQLTSFRIGEANRAAVARLVEMLDGLPLAIELAASRIRILSPAQIVQRLQDRFKLLGGARGTAARQATLRAAIDWSWDLLQPWEQGALAQCSVFEGGFTLQAAEAVLDLTGWPEAMPVIDVVQALVDKSLLRSWMPKGQPRLDIEEPHFAMYVTIHEYAGDKLRASGGLEDAHRAHGAYFARFGGDEAIESLCLHGGVARRRAFSLELDNLLAACRRAVRRGDAEVALSAFRAAGEVFDLQGPVAFGATLGVQVMALPDGDDSLRAAVGAMLGRLSSKAGNAAMAEAWFEQAIAKARAGGAEMQEMSAMGQLANLLRVQGRVGEALALFDVALPQIRGVGNLRLLGQTLGNLGTLHHVRGHVESARDCYEHANELHRQVGNRQGEATMMGNLALLDMEQGRVEESAEGFLRSADIHRETGDGVGGAQTAHNLGALRAQAGRYAEARQQLEASLAAFRATGVRWGEGSALGSLGAVCHGQHDWAGARARYTAALEIHRETANLRFEGGVLLALGNLDRDEGRLDEAERRLELAIAILTQIGERRTLAVAARVLASVLLALHRLDDAGIRLDEAETLLGEIGDAFELGVALCIRGRLLIARGDRERARAMLFRAEATASSMSATSESELGRAISELHKSLD